MTGAIWLGTKEGLQVYDYPDEISILKKKPFSTKALLVVMDIIRMLLKGNITKNKW
jgi:hypothetical protein